MNYPFFLSPHISNSFNNLFLILDADYAVKVDGISCLDKIDGKDVSVCSFFDNYLSTDKGKSMKFYGKLNDKVFILESDEFETNGYNFNHMKMKQCKLVIKANFGINITL